MDKKTMVIDKAELKNEDIRVTGNADSVKADDKDCLSGEPENEDERKETHLLSYSRRGWMRLVFSRTGIILLFLLLGIFLLIASVTSFSRYFTGIVGGSFIFDLIFIIYIMNTDKDPSFKITWILLVAALPVIGGLFYLFTQLDFGSRTTKQAVMERISKSMNNIQQDEKVIQKLEKSSPETLSLAMYARNSGCYPIYDCTDTRYYSLGEYAFEDMIRDLESAKSFIFMEFFIIEEGKMWGEVLDILSRKVKEGVDVRVMYDGTCEITTLPHEYPDKLRAIGIQCKVFSPLYPFVSTMYNYRDHRKILVVDGRCAYTGGVNMADEYINERVRFGHWKDTAVRISGQAVKSMTQMFLDHWYLREDFLDYRTYLDMSCDVYENASGYVMPYGDNPFDTDRVGENIYMDIISRSVRYVHIMTPYLIPDARMLDALCFAAERGVDVKVIFPGIPDKKLAYYLGKTYFRKLIRSKVKIYIYEPGFVHAKVFVSDDIKATVGSVNLDYRSLYHHFECGCYMYDTDCVTDVENDFEETLSRCSKVTLSTINSEKWYVKVLGQLMRLVAPLL